MRECVCVSVCDKRSIYSVLLCNNTHSTCTVISVYPPNFIGKFDRLVSLSNEILCSFPLTKDSKKFSSNFKVSIAKCVSRIAYTLAWEEGAVGKQLNKFQKCLVFYAFLEARVGWDACVCFVCLRGRGCIHFDSSLYIKCDKFLSFDTSMQMNKKENQ